MLQWNSCCALDEIDTRSHGIFFSQWAQKFQPYGKVSLSYMQSVENNTVPSVNANVAIAAWSGNPRYGTTCAGHPAWSWQHPCGCPLGIIWLDESVVSFLLRLVYLDVLCLLKSVRVETQVALCFGLLFRGLYSPGSRRASIGTLGT